MTAVREILRTRSGKAFAGCWLLSVLGFVGFALVGLVDRDVASAIATGALISAAPVDIAVVLSYSAGRASYSIARVTWVALSIALLVSVLSLLASGRTDADMLLAYAAAGLSLPAGLIAGPLVGLLSLPAGSSQSALLWAISIGAGYVQWFVLVPFLLKARAKDRVEVR